MPMPLVAWYVIASVGHMPSTSRNVGFSLKMPFRNVLRKAFISIIPPPCAQDAMRVRQCLCHCAPHRV